MDHPAVAGKSEMIRNKLAAEGRSSRPTIRDVAEAAGVSTATVSNVVRGTCFVRAERQKKVLDARTGSITPSRNATSSG
jgi:hypothetical protein